MASKWDRAITAVKVQNTAVKLLAAVPHGIDANVYFAPSIPTVVRVAVPLLADDRCTDEIFASVLKLVLKGLKTGRSIGDGSITTSDIDSLASTMSYVYSDVCIIVTGVMFMLATAVRNKTKVSVVQAHLKKINVPPKKVTAIVAAIRENRYDLERHFIDSRVRAPSMHSFRWRVDVAISTESLQKVFRPTMLAEITTSEGQIKTFEMPIDQFHRLRYNVAKVLRNMEEVERHPIMRLAFQKDAEAFDRGEDDQE